MHIAGTNGKGSTLTFLASALSAAGFEVGAYTSPHLISYTERITQNLEPVSESRFCELYSRVITAADQIPVTEFEILTVMALCHFAEAQLDIVIVETGLGGRLDATNVLSPALCILTRIGYDHMDILGSTLPEIAAEKAGIIKPGIPVITIPQLPEVQAVIQAHAREAQSELSVVSPVIVPPDYRLNARYQGENLALAREALSWLHDHGFPLTGMAFEEGLAYAQIHGRYMRFACQDHTLILDGAHNPEGVSALILSLQRDYPKEELVFVVGILKRKESTEMLRRLAPKAHRLLVCEFDPGVSITAEDARAVLPEQKVEAWSLNEEIPKGKVVVFSGSLYFVGKLMSCLPEYAASCEAQPEN